MNHIKSLLKSHWEDLQMPLHNAGAVSARFLNHKDFQWHGKAKMFMQSEESTPLVNLHSIF